MNAEIPVVITASGHGLRLQWGRVLMNAEMAEGIGKGKAGRVASMGPRSYERGNVHLIQPTINVSYSFNGAAFL